MYVEVVTSQSSVVFLRHTVLENLQIFNLFILYMVKYTGMTVLGLDGA